MKSQQQSIGIFPDQTVLCAWSEQVSAVAKTPALHRQVLSRQHELLPSFAQHYRRLKALPRHARRSLQRRWKQSLGGIALLFAIGQAPALAATINVGGGCSLVNAIMAANGDTPIGGCSAGSGADTIVLPAGGATILTTVDNSTYGPNGLPVITGAITIVGNNSTIARSQVTGIPDFRLLAVAGTADLTLRSLTLRGGIASGIFPANIGGGVFNNGRLVMTNSTVSGNSAERGGAVYNFSESTIIVASSTISGNTATIGGGVFSSVGTLVLNNSTVSGNTAVELGGGVVNSAGTLSVTNSLFSGNSADYGGGVDNVGSLNVTNSTFSGNSVTSTGGAIRSRSGTATLTSCTLTGNTASAGGGVANSAPGLLTLIRTLISGNVGTNPEVSSNTGTIEADRFNLFGHSGVAGVAGFSPGQLDIVPTVALNAILDPVLRATGGINRTHALVRGSPAVDSAARCDIGRGGGLAQDQRGAPRPFDGDNDGVSRCDIGAFELTFCGGRVPTHIGTSRAEVIDGTPGIDVIDGLSGNDRLNGLAGNDVLCGGVGNDVLDGGVGIDAAAFTGAEILIGPRGVTVNLDTGAATGDALGNLDTLSGIENVIGSAGPDNVTGNAGPNVLIGGRGNDVLFGVGGNDRLLGADGNDAMNGGPGIDTCNGQLGVSDTATACETVIGVP